MKQEPNWQDTPPKESGWYWHHDGDAMQVHFVFTRPGHAYLCTEGEPYGPGLKRNFRMVERMRGHWIEIATPLPPTRKASAS